MLYCAHVFMPFLNIDMFIYSCEKLLTNSRYFSIISCADSKQKGEDSMAKYEYEVRELKEVDVLPCPLFGSDDFHF